LIVSVIPPADIPNGNYTGFLRISTANFGEGVEGHAVGVVRSTLDLAINVEITDIEVRECSASNFKVQSVEKGDDIIFTTNILNTGNIRLKPRIVIDIWDQDQISIVKSEEFSEKEILPTTKDDFTIRVTSKDLEIGQYWADISVLDCYSSGTLTFDILEEGALRAEGILLGILTRKISKLKETVPINARFKNTGEKEVDAQFKGKITLEDQIIQILESEKARVPISDTNQFSFYFTPQKTGKYVISGRVYYSGKKTFETSTTLEVIAGKVKVRSFLMFLIYATLILIIAGLFFKIRRERRYLSTRLRKLK
jgi:hypothetical protein